MRPGPRGRQTHCMELTSIARASGHVVALALVVTGCGVETRDAAGPRTTTSSVSPSERTTPTSSPKPPHTGHKEPISPAGIAAVVREHLGPDNVRRYGSYSAEPGSVDL